ncbi:hypothetical protein HZS_5738 [Henneguya salminicola]|nr:hypothetical protein HZS_5738 [Henneguya salminicola]
MVLIKKLEYMSPVCMDLKRLKTNTCSDHNNRFRIFPCLFPNKNFPKLICLDTSSISSRQLTGNYKNLKILPIIFSKIELLTPVCLFTKSILKASNPLRRIPHPIFGIL